MNRELNAVESHPPKHPPTNARPIQVIVLVNALMLVVSGMQVNRGSSSGWAMVLLGFMFASSALLGLMAGLGEWPWWQRWPLAWAGALLIAVLVPDSTARERNAFFATILLTTLVVGLVTSFLRLRGVLIRRVGHDEPPGQLRQFRFHVRDLFAATLAVAVLVKVGQSLAPKATFGVLFAFGVMFCAVVGMGAWAALGRRPYLRRAVGLVLAGAVSVLGSVYHKPSEYMFWSSCAALEAAVVIQELLWLRRYGYRLIMRESTASAELAPEGSSASNAAASDQTGVP